MIAPRGFARIQLAAGTAYFSYDGRNMVKEIKYPSGQVTSLGYDAVGKLAWKTVDGTPTYYTYDGLNLLAERNASGTVTAEYVYGYSEKERGQGKRKGTFWEKERGHSGF